MKADIAKRKEQANKTVPFPTHGNFEKPRRRFSDPADYLHVVRMRDKVITDARDLPLIDPDADDLVTGWATNMRAAFMNSDMDDCLRRIHGLMDVHPEVIEDAGLDEGYLFEICGTLSSKGRYSESAHLIQRYREVAPKTFETIKGYLDLHLIKYALAGCPDVDLAKPLERFTANVWDYDNSLEQILDLLALAGRQDCFDDIFEKLLQIPDTPYRVYEMTFYGKAVEELTKETTFDELYSRCLANRSELEFSDEDVRKLIQRVVEPGVDVEAALLDGVVEDGSIAAAVRFAAWLHHTKGVPSCLAERHLESIARWIFALHQDRLAMGFSHINIVDFLNDYFQMMRLYLNCPRALQTCQAIYEFGEYLNALSVPGAPDLDRLRTDCLAVIGEISEDRAARIALDILRQQPAYNLLRESTLAE